MEVRGAQSFLRLSRFVVALDSPRYVTRHRFYRQYLWVSVLEVSTYRFEVFDQEESFTKAYVIMSTELNSWNRHTGLMSIRPNAARVEPLPKALEEAKEAMKSSAVNAANVTATLAHNEMVSVGVGRFSRQLLFKGTVPPRLREMVILRMGWNCQSVYEFGQHTLFGLDVGLTEDEIYRLTRPVSEYGWEEEEVALLEMVDDLYNDDCVSDATWLKLTGLFSVSEMLEFMAAALQYRLVSGLLNSCGVQRDDGVPGWPQVPTT